MYKLMVEFLRKFENREIKIVLVNLIWNTNSINLLLLYTVLGVGCDVDIFKLTAR